MKNIALNKKLSKEFIQWTTTNHEDHVAENNICVTPYSIARDAYKLKKKNQISEEIYKNFMLYALSQYIDCKLQLEEKKYNKFIFNYEKKINRHMHKYMGRAL